MTSDAGALLLRETDRAIDLIERVARCFEDGRAGDRVVHTVADSGDRGLTGCTKKLISVSLEMRVDSKHCNVGILALSGR